MPSAEIVYWEDNGSWTGYLQEFPDYGPQGGDIAVA